MTHDPVFESAACKLALSIILQLAPQELHARAREWTSGKEHERPYPLARLETISRRWRYKCDIVYSNRDLVINNVAWLEVYMDEYWEDKV